MRDVTWRPPKHTEPSIRYQHPWLLVALLVINIGVVVYHGDPRSHLPNKHSDTPKHRVQSVVQERSAAEPVVELAGAPLPPQFYDDINRAGAPKPVGRVSSTRLRRGESAAVALGRVGVARSAIHGALSSLDDIVNFRLLRPGHRLNMRFDAQDALVRVDIIQGPVNQARAVLKNGIWHAHHIDIATESMVVGISGTVTTSLWEALVETAKESPHLVSSMVDVFAWEVDFYSQVFPGDTFRVLVEKRYSNGTFVGYGAIEAAEFITAGTVHRAYIHREPERSVALYYNGKGQSMRKQLLKAPLKYGHVTSRFGRRRHPVLGYTRAHNGTDYGVPTGTPVWAVGDGRVVKAGYHGGFGKLIEIRHANGWRSQYAHLSRIKVRVGARVTQKQIIGAVGSTGMSTGPHLHYGLKRHGQYVNSLKQRFEPGKALVGADLKRFLVDKNRLDEQLKHIDLALALGQSSGRP